jgi:hypothetical protein
MKGYIYCLKSSQTELIYIGSTQEFNKRLSKHCSNYKRWQDEKYHYVTSFEIVKYDDCYIELIEELEVEDEPALHKREGDYQRGMECVNKRIEGRTAKEYREDNKAEIKEQKKIYYDEHKAEINEKQKIYYDEHKAEINEKQKIYYQDKCEEILEKVKIYQSEHKAEIKEHKSKKCDCECGGKYTYCHKSRHLKSNRHQEYLSNERS